MNRRWILVTHASSGTTTALNPAHVMQVRAATLSEQVDHSRAAASIVVLADGSHVPVRESVRQLTGRRGGGRS